MWVFLGRVLVGGVFGVIVMALMVASSKDSRWDEQNNRQE